MIEDAALTLGLVGWLVFLLVACAWLAFGNGLKRLAAAAAGIVLAIAGTARYRQRWLRAVRLLEAGADTEQGLRDALKRSEDARLAQAEQVARLSLEVAELELRLGETTEDAAAARMLLAAAQQREVESRIDAAWDEAWKRAAGEAPRRRRR